MGICLTPVPPEPKAELDNTQTSDKINTYNSNLSLNIKTDANNFIQKLTIIQAHVRGKLARKEFLKNKALLTSNNLYKQIDQKEIYDLFTQYSQIEDTNNTNRPLQISFIPEQTTAYYGEVSPTSNKKEGRGIQIWEDGDKYIGYWKNDVVHNKGKLLHPNGDYYLGNFNEGKANGYGVYAHNDGSSKYEGEWKDNLQHGQGKETYKDGSYYEGSYVNGYKNGKGKFKWANGNEYIGNFENNVISGYGVFTWVDGKVYEGEWKDGKMNGKGVFKWENSSKKYEGEYVNDKKEGYGVFTWEDGRIYKGNWKNGKREGQGEYYVPKYNKWVKGVWKNGRRETSSHNDSS